MRPKENGNITIIVLLFLVLVGLLGFLIYSIQSKSKSTPVLAQFVKSTPTPSPWRVYSDPAGFSLTYPRLGVVAQEHDYVLTECGNKIKNENGVLLVDNFYKIKTVDWTKTIQDYLDSQGAGKIYETKVLAGSSADEALSIGSLKKDVEYAIGYPPLAYTKAIYKKGDKLFIMQTYLSPNNFGGCILPEIADPTKFSDYHNLNWDMTQSLKF